MYLCSNTEHELPLNAEYPACVSLDILKMHKQEFNCSFSAEGNYFPIRWCGWKQKKSNTEKQFKRQFKVKQIISDFLQHLYFIILFCERHMNWYKPLWYFLKYVFSLNCSSLVLQFDIYTHFHHVCSEKSTLTSSSTVSAVPICLNPAAFTCMFVCTNYQIVPDWKLSLAESASCIANNYICITTDFTENIYHNLTKDLVNICSDSYPKR